MGKVHLNFAGTGNRIIKKGKTRKEKRGRSKGGYVDFAQSMDEFQGCEKIRNRKYLLTHKIK